MYRLSDEAAEKAVEDAEKANVKLVLTAGIELSSSQRAISIAGKHSRIVRACVGIHPWNADLYSTEALYELKKLTAKKEVAAISELGLDFVGRRTREGKFVDTYIAEEVQRSAFRAQLKAAKSLRLPVIVHDRTPGQEVLDAIMEEGNTETGAAIHGFTGNLAYVKRCVDMGVYVSIGRRGSSEATEDFREVVRWLPLKWLLTETDSDRPGDVVTVAEMVAGLKELRKDDVGRAATENLRRLLKL